MRKTAAALAIILFFSCNNGGTSDKGVISDDKAVSSDDKGVTSGKEQQVKELNEQSLKCIRLMNSLEEQKDAAIASGDAATTTSLSQRIDSAATENAKIGQKLLELQDQK